MTDETRPLKKEDIVRLAFQIPTICRFDREVIPVKDVLGALSYMLTQMNCQEDIDLVWKCFPALTEGLDELHPKVKP